MVDVIPFRAARPRNDLAESVIAPPYDVLLEDEARALAENEKCFVRITRSEVDLPKGTDSHSDAAYEKARDNLKLFLSEGWMESDDAAHFYFYGQKMGDHVQTGIIAAVSAPDYDAGRIKKHEYTRPDKEDDRTHHMDVINAQVGLVFLTYRRSDVIADITATVTKTAPAWKVTTEDGVEHTLWVADASYNDTLHQAFADIDALYVADGHHRCAAASRIHKQRSEGGKSDERSEHFMAGVFPDDELMILSYNRVVHDLNGQTSAAFLASIDEKFTRAPGDAKPNKRGTFSMYFEGKWQTLVPRDGVVDVNDPVKCLDVAVLQDHILAPLLGVDDPRRSTRISFVGGIRGATALSDAVDAGKAVAFHMFPTPLEQLFNVADAGQVMPPKSTWFEPKLREGVTVRLL